MARSDHECRRFGAAAIVVVRLAWMPTLGVACGLDLAERCFAELPLGVPGAALGDGTAFRVGEQVFREGLDVQQPDVLQPLFGVVFGQDDPGPTGLVGELDAVAEKVLVAEIGTTRLCCGLGPTVTRGFALNE